jgi:hypothetical protein
MLYVIVLNPLSIYDTRLLNPPPPHQNPPTDMDTLYGMGVNAGDYLEIDEESEPMCVYVYVCVCRGALCSVAHTSYVIQMLTRNLLPSLYTLFIMPYALYTLYTLYTMPYTLYTMPSVFESLPAGEAVQACDDAMPPGCKDNFYYKALHPIPV